MKSEDKERMTPLSQHDVVRVSGAGFVAVAQDMYGNTMSVEAWMDRNIDMLYNDSLDPHDFYSPGRDPDKPSIWRGS